MSSTSSTDHLADPDDTSPRGDFVRLRGVDVHYLVAGPADAPAVLLSHHFYGSVATWRHVVDGLSDRYRVVAFDRPGFGWTERAPRRRWRRFGNPYTRVGSARIAWALLDHLGIERASLLGSSAGGTHVLEMYRLAPERTRSLVLLSPAITGDIGPPAWSRPWLRRPPLRWLGPPLLRVFAGEVTRERATRSWHDPSRATDDHVRPYQDLLTARRWPRGLWEVLTADDPPDLRELVQRLDVPTLVVGGASDRVISPRWNARTAAAITGAELVVLPGCGHTPHEECPEPLVAEVVRHLDAVTGAA